MRARRAGGGVISASVLAIAMTTATPRASRADEPAFAPDETPAETTASAGVERPPSRPPWTGREAIWGGVGLIVAGAATLIVVAPSLCSSGLFNTGGTGVGAPAATTGSDPRTTCFEATIGGGGAAVGLGVVLLAVGELQRASYKEWLRSHPMFAGATVVPGPGGLGLGLRLRF